MMPNLCPPDCTKLFKIHPKTYRQKFLKVIEIFFKGTYRGKLDFERSVHF